ncbi:hypothetical protein NDU88_005643, partial [Pleurodeles waltl]
VASINKGMFTVHCDKAESRDKHAKFSWPCMISLAISKPIYATTMRSTNRKRLNCQRNNV